MSEGIPSASNEKPIGIKEFVLAFGGEVAFKKALKDSFSFGHKRNTESKNAIFIKRVRELFSKKEDADEVISVLSQFWDEYSQVDKSLSEADQKLYSAYSSLEILKQRSEAVVDDKKIPVIGIFWQPEFSNSAEGFYVDREGRKFTIKSGPDYGGNMLSPDEWRTNAGEQHQWWEDAGAIPESEKAPLNALWAKLDRAVAKESEVKLKIDGLQKEVESLKEKRENIIKKVQDLFLKG